MPEYATTGFSMAAPRCAEAPSIQPNIEKRKYSLGWLVSDGLRIFPRVSDIFAIAVRGRLPEDFREEIMVCVSRANACTICNFTHHDFAQHAGVELEHLRRLERGDLSSLDADRRVAVEWAIARSVSTFGAVDAELQQRFERAFDAQTRADVDLVTRFITIMNLCCNKLEAFSQRVQGEPAEDSRLADELVISALAAAIIPIMYGLVAAGRGESNARVWRDFFEFFEAYEATVRPVLPPPAPPRKAHRTGSVRELLGHALQLGLSAESMIDVFVTRRMDPTLREEVMVAVATLNACKYCSYAHHDFALNAGVSNAELAQLEGIEEEHFDERKFLAIAYARELVAKDFGRLSPRLEREAKAAYSMKERANIQTAARFMMLSSLLCNTADAFVERLGGDSNPESRLRDELPIAGLFFGAIAPVVGLCLAAQRRESPRRTFLDFRRFARSYQSKS